MRIGIFGGSFDPIHNEHISLIQKAISFLNLDKMLVMPSYNPPHKDSHTLDYIHRYNMLNLAFSNLPNVEITEIERHLNYAQSYTYIVLPELKKSYNFDDEFYFIIGADSLINLHRWKNPKDVLSICTLAVFGREGYSRLEEIVESSKVEYGDNIVILPYEGNNYSSSLIKAHIELNLPLQDYLPSKVIKYIKDNQLYQNHHDIIAKLKDDISQKTYQHSVRTVLYAVKFVNLYYFNYNEVFLASLLHDNAKDIQSVYSESDFTEVKHQFLGAERLQSRYGIFSSTIEDAIKYHTTAKPDISLLGMLVYVSDKLEYGRNYSGVEILRELCQTDLRAGFVATLQHSYNYLLSKEESKNIHPLTLETIKYYS